jgi:hypothetical protein
MISLTFSFWSSSFLLRPRPFLSSFPSLLLLFFYFFFSFSGEMMPAGRSSSTDWVRDRRLGKDAATAQWWWHLGLKTGGDLLGFLVWQLRGL